MEMSAKSAWKGLMLLVAMLAALLLPLWVLPAWSAQGPEEDSMAASPRNVPTSSGGGRASQAGTVIGYSVDSDMGNRLWRIDMNTGEATVIGFTGIGDIESLSFSSTRVLYGVADSTDQLVRCNLLTGACTAVGPLGVNFTDSGLTFSGDGRLWMSTDEPGPPFRFYRLNRTTGAATLVGPQGQEVTGLAWRGGVVYGLGGDAWDNLVTMDTSTGAATPVGPLGTVTLVDGGIDFDVHGVLWGINDTSSGAGNPSQIFTIDTSTGAATVIATVYDSNGGYPRSGFEGLAIWPSEERPPEEEPFIPEAGSMLLLGSGLLGLAAYASQRWRRQN